MFGFSLQLSVAVSRGESVLCAEGLLIYLL